MSTLFLIVILLWDHIKLHISQTRRRAGNPAVRFTTICLSNMPLNFLSSFEACLPYKITYFSNINICQPNNFMACLPYKITYFSNNTSNVKYYRQACLPYKITYFSNIYCFQIKSVFCLFTIQNYILLKRQS